MPPGPSAAWLRLLRPHQWSKNLLLVVPAVAAHRAPDAVLLGRLSLAVLIFSLAASGLYAINDALDAEHDRSHPEKRMRPVASGEISPAAAITAGAVLLAGAAAGSALWMPLAFSLWLAGYAVLSASYSAGLKRVLMLDVVLLSALYTVRVVAGAAAVDVALSRWFLAFSVFVFVSLALLKRAAEARGAREEGRPDLGGRGWRVEDLPVLLALGSACAVAASLVYCLYITGDDVLALYGSPDLLWLGLPVLLYWLSRAWLLAFRGVVHQDPVVFALRDPVSYACLIALAGVVWLAA